MFRHPFYIQLLSVNICFRFSLLIEFRVNICTAIKLLSVQPLFFFLNWELYSFRAIFTAPFSKYAIKCSYQIEIYSLVSLKWNHSQPPWFRIHRWWWIISLWKRLPVLCVCWSSSSSQTSWEAHIYRSVTKV